MEIKRAIELIKESHPYAVKYKGVEEDEALQLLISIAERVQQLESIHPEDLEDSNMLKRVVKIINELINDTKP